LVGADAAGPLLFDVFDGITSGPEGPDPVPDDLGWVEVCAYSGRRPTEACPHTDEVRAVLAHVPTEVCPYHRRVEIDVASGLAVSPACRSGRTTEAITVLAWPASTRRWLRSSRRILPEIPGWAPGCEVVSAATEPPRIVSPPDGQAAVLIAGLDPERQQVPLEAESDVGGRLSWFVDGRFLAAAPSDERVWWTPRPGEHRIVVTDAKGRSTGRRFAVLERP
jgi:penicillin-binding protein 1C